MCIVDDGQLWPAAKKQRVAAVSAEDGGREAGFRKLRYQWLNLQSPHNHAHRPNGGATLENSIEGQRCGTLPLSELTMSECCGEARVVPLIRIGVPRAEIQTGNARTRRRIGKTAKHNRRI